MKLVGQFVLVVFLICFYLSSFAQGDLLVSPRRVVFDNNKRFQELNLVNTGKDTAVYNISFKQYRMKEEGGFEEITTPEPGQKFASPFLRYFPRRVYLAPNESQLVKMQLSRSSQMGTGEYRSHVYFRAVPNEAALGQDKGNEQTQGLSVSLKPIFGITIPVIIRKGESTTKVSLSNLKLESNNSKPQLSFSFHRSGNMSVYGDVKVVHTSPNGVETSIGVVKGVAVYTPNTVRHFRMNLDENANVDYQAGKLEVFYKKQGGGLDRTLAQGVIRLN